MTVFARKRHLRSDVDSNEVFGRPVSELIENRYDGDAGVGQRIRHAGWSVVANETTDESRADQFVESVREDRVRQGRQAAAQLGERTRPRTQRTQ